MDAADNEAFCPLDLQGARKSALQRLKVADGLLDFFRRKPVHTMVDGMRNEARRVHSTAVMEVFQLGLARVAAVNASPLIFPAPQSPGPQSSQSPAAPVLAPQGAHGGSTPRLCMSGCPPDRL